MKSAKKNNSFLSRLAKLPVSFIMMAIFLLPLYFAANWVNDVFLGGIDNRKLIEVDPLTAYQESESPLRPFSEPLISITFDDGWESSYTNGLPLFHKYNVPTTHYILGGEFDNPLYLSSEQVKSLLRAGHDIASHTMTHADLTELNDDKLAWELDESKKILSGNFGVEAADDFASPLGAYDDRTLDHIQKRYRSHRDTSADVGDSINDLDINLASNFDRYKIIGFTVRTYTDIGHIADLIDYAVKNNGWLVLNYHQIDDSGSEYSVTPQQLEEHLQAVINSKARVVTVDQFLTNLPEGDH